MSHPCAIVNSHLVRDFILRPLVRGAVLRTVFRRYLSARCLGSRNSLIYQCLILRHRAAAELLLENGRDETKPVRADAELASEAFAFNSCLGTQPPRVFRPGGETLAQALFARTPSAPIAPLGIVQHDSWLRLQALGYSPRASEARDFNGEFDPGSGRTLVAGLTHASRTRLSGACTGKSSGERVSNT